MTCLVASLALLQSAVSPSASSDALVAHYAWNQAALQAGAQAPKLVPFRGSYALSFDPARHSFLDLGQGDKGRLRLTRGLTLAAVVQLNALPRSKAAVISKWRLDPGARAYELGITPGGQVFFTVSASGMWPDQAKELVSYHKFKLGVPYAVAAAFQPGQRMAITINGAPSGELLEGVPGAIFDSPTPVFLGNRPGGESYSALDGLIAGVWVYSAGMETPRLVSWAAEQGLTDPPGPVLPRLAAPYDLDVLKAQVRLWYEELQAPGRP